MNSELLRWASVAFDDEIEGENDTRRLRQVDEKRYQIEEEGTNDAEMGKRGRRTRERSTMIRQQRQSCENESDEG